MPKFNEQHAGRREICGKPCLSREPASAAGWPVVSLIARRVLNLTLLAAWLAGCSPVFNVRSAREISRESLLGLADRGQTNHLWYVGSDEAYHYVADVRAGQDGSYKVRVDRLKLQETFRVGEDEAYVLWPWLIEGKRMGRRPEELTNSPQTIAK
ncbi:MAG: hypothetical protein ACT4QC_16865 [Planctomycetaceae bacterium]